MSLNGRYGDCGGNVCDDALLRNQICAHLATTITRSFLAFETTMFSVIISIPTPLPTRKVPAGLSVGGLPRRAMERC